MPGCPDHPYGVKPFGNAFLETNETNKFVRRRGLGYLAAIRDDDILLEVLSFCSQKELVRLNVCSRVFYVFSMHNELWRDLMLRACKGNFMFHKTWKDTYAQHFSICGPIPCHNPIKVDGIYSHALHQSWLCRNIDLESQCKGFHFDNIPRRDQNNLSNLEFIEKFELKNTPVIITGIVNQWPAFHKWNSSYLAATCQGFNFRATSATAAGTASFTMQQYEQYAEQTNEEAPLYLFERDFHSISTLQDDYSVPIYFAPEVQPRTDLFRLLGETRRPDFKWLVIGPARYAYSLNTLNQGLH